jgi:predicted XRE-type DNA-binding protein
MLMTARVVHFDGRLPDDLHGAIVGDLMAFMGRRRISQRRLAATLGVDQSTVSRWFNKDMTVADLDRVLAALGLAGRLAFVDAETGESTAPKVRPLVSIPTASPHSQSSHNGTQSPLMHSVLSPV